MMQTPEQFETAPWVTHGFFTRHDSGAADIAAVLGVAPEKVITAKQVHGIKVLTVTTPWETPPEADALVTDRAGLALAIITADCAPVLFTCHEKRIIGAAHAGWRGALGGVIESTVAAMVALGAQAEDISAIVGPCIGARSYEVSAGFEAPFLEQDSANAAFFRPAAQAGHLMFDLPGYVVARLRACGVAKVKDTACDTLSQEDLFYSHRRSTLQGGADKGRQLSAIAMRE